MRIEESSRSQSIPNDGVPDPPSGLGLHLLNKAVTELHQLSNVTGKLI